MWEEGDKEKKKNNKHSLVLSRSRQRDHTDDRFASLDLRCCVFFSRFLGRTNDERIKLSKIKSQHDTGNFLLLTALRSNQLLGHGLFFSLRRCRSAPPYLFAPSRRCRKRRRKVVRTFTVPSWNSYSKKDRYMVAPFNDYWY